MNCRLVFLLSLPYIINVATAAPLSTNELKTTVKWMAEQLVVKLNTFDIPRILTMMPPSREQYGASSIALTLDGYNNLIVQSFNGASEVKTDIGSLYRTVEKWRKLNCSERPQPQPSQALVDLRNRSSTRKYNISITYSALHRVKVYLKNLLKNMEQLETCT